MTWETFYERFYDWADSTQVSNISKLTTFGPSAEVCEIAQSLFDEKVAARLIKKAMAAGVRFTSEEVVELDGCVDEALFSELAITASTPFTADDLDTISCSVSESALKTAANKSNVKLDEDNCVILPSDEMDAQTDRMPEDLGQTEEDFEEDDQNRCGNAGKPGVGAFLLGILAAWGKNDKQHNGRCDGDCANCPPHYGYRYGRWYHGHGHQYGCQRGGNGGASGKCYRD